MATGQAHNYSNEPHPESGATVRSLGPLECQGAPDGTTHVGARKGCLLVDTTNAKLYINTGTPAAPTWTVAGTQS